MERRTFVTTLASFLAAGATAGCIESDGSSGASTVTSPTGTSTQTATESPTDTPSSTTATTASPGYDGDISEELCPSFVDNADETLCTHTATHADIDVLLRPSSDRLEPSTAADSVESITFELANGSDRTVGLNPYAWRLERKTDEGWTYVAPGEHIEPWYHLESGDSYQWQLSVEDQTGSDEEQTIRIVEDLQSGLYAFGIDGIFGDIEEDGARIEWVALFVVDR